MKRPGSSSFVALGAALQRLGQIVIDRSRAAVLANSLLVMLLLANFVMLILGFVYAQYLGIDVLTSLTFPAADGWCTVPQESLGRHCFGDYALTVKIDASPNPWMMNIGIPWNYPAGAMLPSALFLAMGNLVGHYKVGLFAYLAAGAIALSVPAIWAARNKTALTKALVISTMSITAIPAVMALDRGNSVMFAVPVFLVYLGSLSREKYKITLLAVVLASLVKPQFVVLALIFLVIRRYRLFLAAIFSAVFVNVLAFALWPANFPSTIIQAVRNTFAYSDAHSLSEGFPTNVSLAKPIYWLEFAIRKATGRDTHASWTDTHQMLATAIVVATALALMAVSGRYLAVELQASILLVIASLAVPVSWSYYLVFALPIAAVIIRDPSTESNQLRNSLGLLDRNIRERSRSEFVVSALLLLAVTLSVSRLLLPMTDPSRPTLLVGSGELASASWLVFIIAAPLISVVKRLRPRGSRRAPDEPPSPQSLTQKSLP